MTDQAGLKGPYKLVTVNTVPARAKIIIGRVVEALKDRYTIDYVANSETIENVRQIVITHTPDILCCASMWTKSQSDEIRNIARSVEPKIKTTAIPEGLQVAKGPDGVFEWLMDELPKLIDGESHEEQRRG